MDISWNYKRLKQQHYLVAQKNDTLSMRKKTELILVR